MNSRRHYLERSCYNAATSEPSATAPAAFVLAYPVAGAFAGPPEASSPTVGTVVPLTFVAGTWY